MAPSLAVGVSILRDKLAADSKRLAAVSFGRRQLRYAFGFMWIRAQ